MALWVSPGNIQLEQMSEPPLYEKAAYGQGFNAPGQGFTSPVPPYSAPGQGYAPVENRVVFVPSPSFLYWLTNTEYKLPRYKMNI